MTRYQHQQKWGAPVIHCGSPAWLQSLKKAGLHAKAIRSQLTTALQTLSQNFSSAASTKLAFTTHTLYPSTSLAACCQKAGQGEQDRAARNQLQDWGYHHRLSTWENQAKANPKHTKPCQPQLALHQAKGWQGKSTIQLKLPRVNQESTTCQGTGLPQASTFSIQMQSRNATLAEERQDHVHPWDATRLAGEGQSSPHPEPEPNTHLLQNI